LGFEDGVGFGVDVVVVAGTEFTTECVCR
jgi:hypothetical protein